MAQTALAKEWVYGLVANNPYKETQEIAEQLKNLHEKKLWHQLTVSLENFVNHPVWNGVKDEKLMVDLYEKFIRDFETRINQLKLVKIGLAIVPHIRHNGEAIHFVQKFADKITPESDKEAHCLALSEIAYLKLVKLNQPEESKAVNEKVGALLETITGADSSVYSSYYRYLSLYYKQKVAPTEFYRNSLMYLVYTPIEQLSVAEQQSLAFDMGIAALVSNDIYNFGELLAHPILKSLQGTKVEWLLTFLNAFNSGDLGRFEKFLQTNKADIDSQSILSSNIVLLRQKISILALMELVFNKSAEERTLPFKAIAEATKLPVEEVELLVMKALSLKLVKGVIDEVNQTVAINWVQPRVLDLEQVKKMKARIGTWMDTTNQVLAYLETTTAPELFA